MAITSFVLKMTNRCNIDCDYCYVFNSADQIARTLPARMSDQVLRVAGGRIREYCLAKGLTSCHVIFHGGEPLLVGPRRMGEIFPLLRSLLDPLDVTFVVQTNGTLINDRWLDLFTEHRVKVGVSLDGPAEVNDLHRLGHRGQSTSASAVAGIRALRARDGLLAGLLAVIDSQTDPVRTYDFLASLRPPVIDFALPHATHDSPPARRRGRDAEYGDWLCAVFDRWATSDGDVRIRMFDDIVALSMGAKSSVDSLGLAGSGMLTIESDGGIEGFDALRTVRPGESQLGLSVFDDSLDEAGRHPALVDQAQGGQNQLGEVCRSCDLVAICGGGYQPHRFGAQRGYLNPSVFCKDLDRVIRHVESCVSLRLSTAS